MPDHQAIRVQQRDPRIAVSGDASEVVPADVGLDRGTDLRRELDRPDELERDLSPKPSGTIRCSRVITLGHRSRVPAIVDAALALVARVLAVVALRGQAPALAPALRAAHEAHLLPALAAVRVPVPEEHRRLPSRMKSQVDF
jgi:hypothetical protein